MKLQYALSALAAISLIIILFLVLSFFNSVHLKDISRTKLSIKYPQINEYFPPEAERISLSGKPLAIRFESRFVIEDMSFRKWVKSRGFLVSESVPNTASVNFYDLFTSTRKEFPANAWYAIGKDRNNQTIEILYDRDRKEGYVSVHPMNHD